MSPRSPALIPLLLIPALVGCQALLEGKYPLENLHLSPARGISLRADLFCEISCGITYRVWDPANGAGPWGFVGYTGTDPGEVEWTLRVSPSERWMGLADKLYPNVILALHDYETGFDWPSCQDIPRDRCELRAYEGLMALQEPGGQAHILSTQQPGSAEARVSP